MNKEMYLRTSTENFNLVTALHINTDFITVVVNKNSLSIRDLQKPSTINQNLIFNNAICKLSFGLVVEFCSYLVKPMIGRLITSNHLAHADCCYRDHNSLVSDPAYPAGRPQYFQPFTKFIYFDNSQINIAVFCAGCDSKITGHQMSIFEPLDNTLMFACTHLNFYSHCIGNGYIS